MYAMQRDLVSGTRVGQLVLCTAVALALNAAFAWAAFESTATVPPLRVWQQPVPAAPASARLALDRSSRVQPAALVE